MPFKLSRSTKSTVNRLPNALAEMISALSVDSNIARFGRPVNVSVNATDSRCWLCAFNSYCLRLSSRFCSASCATSDSKLVVRRSTSIPPPRGAGALRLREAATSSAHAVKSATGRSMARLNVLAIHRPAIIVTASTMPSTVSARENAASSDC